MATDEVGAQRGDGVQPTDGDGDGDGADVRAQTAALAASARRAGRKAVLTGRWLADTVVEVAPRLPVRDAATLSAHHGGLTGDELSRSVIRGGARVSGGTAAAAGGVITAQEVSVAGLLLVPFELAALTVLVVVVEVKLVTELHHVAGRELPGGPRRRTAAAIVSWMSGRAAPPSQVSATVRGDLLGRAGRQELAQHLRSRFTRNLTAVAPLFTGAVAAGYVNRRATLDVGTSVARDLGLHP